MLCKALAPRTIRVSELTVVPLVTLTLPAIRAPPVKNLRHKKAAGSATALSVLFFTLLRLVSAVAF